MDVVEMYEMMQTLQVGQPGSTVEIVPPGKDEIRKFTEPQMMPDGKRYKFPLKPYKQLVIVADEKSANGSSKSTSKVVLAEQKGELVIPVPVPAK